MDRSHDTDTENESESSVTNVPARVNAVPPRPPPLVQRSPFYSYELWGAPGLCYRNRETYTLQDDERVWNASHSNSNESATKSTAAAAFMENQARLHRCMARWYYPTDFHVWHHVTTRLPFVMRKMCTALIKRKRTKRLRVTLQTLDTVAAVTRSDSSDDEDAPEGNSQATLQVNDVEDTEKINSEEPTVPATLHELMLEYDNTPTEPLDATVDTGGPLATNTLTKTKERNAALKRAYDVKDYQTDQIFALQVKARAHMLVTGLDGTNRADMYQESQRLRAYTQLDANYVPGMTLKTRRTYVHTMTSVIRHQTQLYDRERRHRADPAYLAPWDGPSLHATTHSDSRDSVHAPLALDNCLVIVACQCSVCRATGHEDDAIPDANGDQREAVHRAVPCLLHPVGPLQDRIRLSFLALPRGRDITLYVDPLLGIPEEIELGARVRQLVQCGRDPYLFVARTDVNCSVVSVTFTPPPSFKVRVPGECWGTAQLTVLHRLDHRTMWRGKPSYQPLHVTSHARFGMGESVPAKLAVAYKSSNGDRNMIHHVHVNSTGAVAVQKHVVGNLQDIAKIEFSYQHPMVLWSAARSFVRPALTTSYLNHKQPKIGHGTALYSIDLRIAEGTAATFQWSPSAEEFASEGTHSISGLHTDWSQEHCLWVSSISAGRTWEVDTRMPYRAVHSWSLPHLCDQEGALLPPSGLDGVGVLLARPVNVGFGATDLSSSPMMCVNTTPGSFGLHLYQRPTKPSRFHTKSIECIACPGLGRLQDLSATTSSVFPLPDVSDHVFTCGLATFRTPRESFATPAEYEQLGYSADEVRDILCAVTLTNKGDLYTHTLLESTTSKFRGKSFDGLPLGSTVVPAPETNLDTTKATSWNVLRIPLSNEFPMPSQSLRPVLQDSHSSRNTVDLSWFIDNEEAELKRSLRREHLRKLRADREARDEATTNPTTEEKPAIKVEPEREEDTVGIHQPVFQVPEVPERSVIASLPGRNSRSLTLPAHLSLESNDRRMEQFIKHMSVVETQQSDNCRSDLTSSILVNAWNDDDTSESENSL